VSPAGLCGGQISTEHLPEDSLNTLYNDDKY
jgi:hypothetical protein